MAALLALIPLLPLASACALLLLGRRLPRRLVGALGVGSVGLAALLVALLAALWLPSQQPLPVQLWRWLAVAGLEADIALRLDGLALVWLCVITGVGFLIHLYSVEFMAQDADYARYFAYLNLFVAAMLLLVLGDNLLLLFLGWEGVGLCSYLLIGFWYRDAANGAAARKAFVVTRIGDAAMALPFDQLDQLEAPLQFTMGDSKLELHWDRVADSAKVFDSRWQAKCRHDSLAGCRTGVLNLQAIHGFSVLIFQLRPAQDCLEVRRRHSNRFCCFRTQFQIACR